MADEDASQPHTVRVVPPVDAMHYTHTSQLPAFREKINTVNRRDAGVYLNEKTNEITWWGGSYRMPLGFWLLDGRDVYSGEFVQQVYRPAPMWSDEQNDYFANHPSPY